MTIEVIHKNSILARFGLIFMKLSGIDEIHSRSCPKNILFENMHLFLRNTHKCVKILKFGVQKQQKLVVQAQIKSYQDESRWILILQPSCQCEVEIDL
jgi:hypothetical protein